MSSTAAETQDFLVGFSAASFGVGSLMPTNEAPLGSQAQGKACGQTAKRSQVASFPEAVVAPEGGGGGGVFGGTEHALATKCPRRRHPAARPGGVPGEEEDGPAAPTAKRVPLGAGARTARVGSRGFWPPD